MKRTSMEKISAVLLLAAVCIAPKSRAQGTLQITFDGPPMIPPGTGVVATNYSESGMAFRPIPPSYGFSRYGEGAPGGGPDDGSTYLSAAVTQSLMFNSVDGLGFNLVSVDLAEYSAAFQEPITVHFVGYRQDGSIITTDFITDGIIDGTGPLADFQTFYFDQEWSGLTRVEIPTSLWSLDNLVVSVPEPTSGILAILGAALTALSLRRHKG